MWAGFIFSLRQELIVTGIIFLLLFIKVGATEYKTAVILNLVNGLLLANFILGFIGCQDSILFSGMFHTNKLLVLEKNILNLGTLIISLQAYDWLKGHRQVLEFYLLLLATLVGFFFMISAGNLLMFYLGLELSTIPLAALSSFDLEKRQSSEAAMKFIMSSAFSSALLLFGISLLYGATGTLDFDTIGQRLDGSAFQLFAFILLLSGFAFKISVVPFHLWTADVYEGSPVTVSAYLSVISKGAVFFVFIQVLYTVFKPLAANWYRILVLLSILTMVTGNLFALRQDKLKRLLAFSSIAQSGFILAGITGSSRTGDASVIYFILVYIFSNLGAFGVVSLISAQTGKEGIDDYKGLYATNPLLSWVMAISLFSLAGIPPTAGFFGKFFLLMAGVGKGNYVFIGIAALNMVISLYYYLRVIKAIFMESQPEPIGKLTIPFLPNLAFLICVAGIIMTGLMGWVYDYIYSLSIGL
ncbi:NADH-quinone oxidoreductase subunit N [Flavitalea sp. BT771]|uniref:NADH-quinone oxidoreductase subunit N n=1 Tax=Flavitalea sp. BT771 TaxID=3063329 RepID=UPI0026E18C54|nr:NADH-quinone oxidoreductase subunit N [Flavitalea sp. BT771]MDO6429770.1 NADH-quinone oxidoreductase subunit N [Flavitalea sp. BT771]MDV6218102.1 NADH-quinone oxidoreductase subunit N [Flavitalea sp. BT771]